jgi:hypothetical protein
MANQENVEPLLKKVKTEKGLFFTGKKIHCLDQLIHNQSWGNLYSGYWQDREQRKEVVVRRLKKKSLRDNWINIVDRQKTNSLTHKNVLNVIGYEEDIGRWR